MHMSLSRIIVIIAALIVASVAACAALALGIIAADMDSNPIERVSFFAGSFFSTSYFGAVTIVPAFVLIVLGETLRMRSVIYYGAAGALVGLASYFGSNISLMLENTTDVPPVEHALPLAAAAGIIGGGGFWVVGRRQNRPRPANWFFLVGA